MTVLFEHEQRPLANVLKIKRSSVAHRAQCTTFLWQAVKPRAEGLSGRDSSHRTHRRVKWSSRRKHCECILHQIHSEGNATSGKR